MKHLTLSAIGLFVVMLLFSSCQEHFVDAERISIWNYDSIPLDIYVDGDKAVQVDEFFGAVYLNTGTYELVAKSGLTEVDRVGVTIVKETDDNQYNKTVFVVGGGKDYAMLNVGVLYSSQPERPFELEETYFDVNLLEIENNPYRMYYPWSSLPLSVYTSAGTPSVYQLFELPKGYQDKSDEEILAYCSALVQ